MVIYFCDFIRKSAFLLFEAFGVSNNEKFGGVFQLVKKGSLGFVIWGESWGEIVCFFYLASKTFFIRVSVYFWSLFDNCYKMSFCKIIDFSISNFSYKNYFSYIFDTLIINLCFSRTLEILSCRSSYIIFAICYFFLFSSFSFNFNFSGETPHNIWV